MNFITFLEELLAGLKAADTAAAPIADVVAAVDPAAAPTVAAVTTAAPEVITALQNIADTVATAIKAV